MNAQPVTAMIIGLVLGLWTGPVMAYELRTHGAITDRAFTMSTGLATYLNAVGIADTDRFQVEQRTPRAQLADFDNDLTPRGWMIEGVIREDDFTRHPVLGFFGCIQPANPTSDIDRPTNHFLDVQHDERGLPTPTGSGVPATLWALGLQGRGPEPAGNAFTILDARIYQLQSLIAPSRVDRDRATARFFRALGQVIHLLQDMAQPQHTRNDPHLGCFTIIGGELSWYEEYIETRALRHRFLARGVEPPELPSSNYDPVERSDYRDFFVSQSDRKGMADFSSFNFLSAGTNLSTNCDGLPLPPCVLTAYTRRDTPFSFTMLDRSVVSGTVPLFFRAADDLLTGQNPDVAVTTRSLWDQHLTRAGKKERFTLNTLNYDSMAAQLIPRAVGYSAGLLNYAFRAKLDVTLAHVTEGDPPTDTNRLRLTAVNASREDMTNGTLTIVYERTDGQRLPVQIVSPAPNPNKPGVIEPVSAAPSDPLPVVEFTEPVEAVVRYVVVYRGTLGQELAGYPSPDIVGAVAAQTIDVGWVERVAALGTQRTLTNANGAFTFPPAVDGLERRRFGDANNWIVGTQSLESDPALPDQVRAFEIARPVDDTEVPLQFDETTSTDYVKLQGSRLADFPYGLDLGVQVTFAETLQNTHRLLILEVDRGETKTVTLVQRDPTVVTSTSGWTTRLVLERSRLMEVAGADSGPYAWRVAEVGLDARQRPLALIEVRLNTVQPRTETGTEQALNEDCEDVPGLSILATSGRLPDVGSIWAVIDVQAGRVLGVSSEANVSIGVLSTGGNWSLYVKNISHSESGTTVGCTLPANAHGPEPDDTSPPLATVNLTPSVLTRTFTGQYRPDLQKAVGTSLTPFSGTESEDLVVASELSDLAKIRFQTAFAGQSGYFTLLRQGVRMGPGDRPQAAYLLRFARPIGIAQEGEEGVLAKWVPESPAQTGIALNDELPAATSYELKQATPKWALIRRDGGSSMLLVDVDRKVIVREYFGQQASDLNNDFVLLPSRLLYNVETTHAYEASTLTETGVPPLLFGAPFVDSDPGAAYQLFGRR